ncbi:MAG: phage tail family protein [Ruminococcus sp.]|nr:phage tail family protein [Ruminococcus sp.]
MANKKIICESYLGEKLEFNYRFPFHLDDVSGLHEMLSTVSGMTSAYGVGEIYAGTSINKRNIVIKGTITDNIINNRQLLYRIFPQRTIGTLYYYEDDLARKIKYRVESIKIDFKGIYKAFQISLICQNPYFTDVDKTTLQMATWLPAFKFPLQIPEVEGIKFGKKNTNLMAVIKNDSNIEYGMTIIFKANDIVINPSLFNVDSREEMKVNISMNAGDKVIVSTYRENKNIIYIPSATGKEENINNLMVYGSKFLQVHRGINTFRYNADEGADNLEAIIEFYQEYEAI